LHGRMLQRFVDQIDIAEGRQLLPDSVLKIRDQGDARKLDQARKLLDEFFAREGKKRAPMP
ncbi:MAG: hypothetical protein ACLPZJ_04935, partial [Terriglobales bacterium]